MYISGNAGNDDKTNSLFPVYKKTIFVSSCEISSLLILNDGRLASCSFDNLIRIFDINNDYKCDLSIEGHNDIITYICQLNNNKLISCSFDKSLKIWEICKSSYRCEYSINNAHNLGIYKVIQLTKNRIASCGMDSKIQIWNSNSPYNIIITLENNSTYYISIIQLKGKEMLLSGGHNRTLYFWNLLTYQCESMILSISGGWINSIIQIDDNRVATCGNNNVITIVNCATLIIEKTIADSQLGYILCLLLIKNGILLCGCQGGKMCLIDLRKNIIQIKEKAHNKSIPQIIKFNTRKLISCAWDGTINFWDF